MNTPPRFFAAPPPSPGDKAVLRGRVRSARRALAAAEPDAAVQIAAVDIGLTGRPVVASYTPQGSEVDPGPLAERLALGGARLALPAVTACDGPLVFRLAAAGGRLSPDAAGVPAPGPEAQAVTPDIVLVPLLAFDGAGVRLGQGGGHYDRALAALRAGGRVMALGLAYAGQEAAALPVEAHDQRLDAVLTPCGLRVFAPIWPP